MPTSPQPEKSSPCDIFISYSTKDRKKAKELRRIFQAYGWTVWIDRRNLRVGQRYREKIDEALANAKAVVVIWSKNSAKSAWVRAEAKDALKRETFAPVRIDDSQPPKPYGDWHTADLSRWDWANLEDENLRTLLQSVAEMLDRPLPAKSPKLPGRLERLLNAYGQVLLSAACVAVILTWFVLNFGLPVWIGITVPLLGVLLKLAIGRIGISILLVTIAVLSLFTSVSIRNVGFNFNLEGQVFENSKSAPIRHHRFGPASDSVRWRIFVPPWGRKIRFELEGHEPSPAWISPWNGATAVVGTELLPRPALLVRVPRKLLGNRDGLTIRVEQGTATIAEARLMGDQGALLVNPDEWLRKFGDYPGGAEARWTADFPSGAPWSNETRVNWKGTPPNLDAEIKVRVVTAGGSQYSSQPLNLRGAITDVEPTVKRDVH